jgi:site-specific recombinase XerC
MLRSLRGESLIVAMLAYGIGLRISELMHLAARDISLKDMSIFVAGRHRKLPEVAVYDLRELIQGRICGYYGCFECYFR